MAREHNAEFKREAVRIALTRGQVAFDLDVGFSTLAKWRQQSKPDDLPPAADTEPAGCLGNSGRCRTL